MTDPRLPIDVADRVAGDGAAARPRALRPRAGGRLPRHAQARLRLRDPRPHGRERASSTHARRSGRRAPAACRAGSIAPRPTAARSTARSRCCVRRWRSSRRRRNELRVPHRRLFRSLPVDDAFSSSSRRRSPICSSRGSSARRSRVANRVAVLKAVAGGLRQDVPARLGQLLKLTLLPFCYYMFPLAVGIEYFKTGRSSSWRS